MEETINQKGLKTLENKHIVNKLTINVYLKDANSNLFFRRPVVYYITNTINGEITGVSVTSGERSWKAILDAVNNCTSDKVILCKKFDISITDEEWTTSILPKVICIDKSVTINSEFQRILQKYEISIEIVNSFDPYSNVLIERVTNNLTHCINEIIKRGCYNTFSDKEIVIMNMYDFIKVVYQAIVNYNAHFTKGYKYE